MLTNIKGLHHLTSMGASTQENSDLPRRSAAPRKEDCEFRRPGGLSQSMASAPRFCSIEVDPDKAITGFHRTSLPLKDAGATRELISFMGTRRWISKATGRASPSAAATAPTSSLWKQFPKPISPPRRWLGDHIPFAVDDRAAQLEVRKA